jgi:hypothetical protein
VIGEFSERAIPFERGVPDSHRAQQDRGGAQYQPGVQAQSGAAAASQARQSGAGQLVQDGKAEPTKNDQRRDAERHDMIRLQRKQTSVDVGEAGVAEGADRVEHRRPPGVAGARQRIAVATRQLLVVLKL